MEVHVLNWGVVTIHAAMQDMHTYMDNPNAYGYVYIDSGQCIRWIKCNKNSSINSIISKFQTLSSIVHLYSVVAGKVDINVEFIQLKQNHNKLGP